MSPLRRLPKRIAKKPSILALRNLERGRAFELACGQAVATALGERPIDDKELMIGKATDDDPRKEPIVQIAEGFADRAPLWAYILSEAQVTSWKNADPSAAPNDIPIKLGPVGGRIVAEVFAALLRADRTSYLRTDHSRRYCVHADRGLHSRRTIRSRRTDQRRARPRDCIGLVNLEVTRLLVDDFVEHFNARLVGTS